jgi:glycosyltransferase involved in cell wall biosynthesis
LSDGRRLRILQVLRAPVGGLFRHVRDLTQSLAGRGHEIGIVADSLTADGLTAERLEQLAPYATLGIHRLPMPRLFGWADLTTPFAIRALARRLDVQVLHGHGAKGGLGARLARIGRRDRIALYTPHGGVLNFPLASRTGKLFRAIERGILPHTDAIVFESAFAKRSFEAMIARPSCPAPVIHNGLATEEFEPIEPGPDAHDFVFIGEFRAVKGIEYLLEALPSVRRPDGRPASLIMAGAGPDVEKTRARIAALGLEQRVTLAGVQPARKMLALGFCVLVPSLAESLPYVILEAAAAGRPVIATDVGGVAEIFGPTAPSLLPTADSKALRAAMQQALDHPEGALEEARQRLDFIREGFSLAHMTDQIESLYLNLLSTR